MCAVASPCLRSATPADARGIRDLLERSDLPTGDLDTAHAEFVIACAAEQIVGVGALQRAGNAALLRSVAVEPRWRGSGVGRLLVAELERRARAAGIGELILLTLTAREFFARLGYRARSRDQAPPAVQATAEFRSLCPAAAACMGKSLR
jgi:amino-acid N-acetyltransferase